jgi:hypothetical protein
MSNQNWLYREGKEIIGVTSKNKTVPFVLPFL